MRAGAAAAAGQAQRAAGGAAAGADLTTSSHSRRRSRRPARACAGAYWPYTKPTYGPQIETSDRLLSTAALQKSICQAALTWPGVMCGKSILFDAKVGAAAPGACVGGAGQAVPDVRGDRQEVRAAVRAGAGPRTPTPPCVFNTPICVLSNHLPVKCMSLHSLSDLSAVEVGCLQYGGSLGNASGCAFYPLPMPCMGNLHAVSLRCRQQAAET